MKRDPAALSGPTYDVAVVGGGIYGLCAVHEAARRGLTACLVERGDFVGATSSNSLKVIHGGLRYLQHGDLRRMRESIRERARLLRLAPHLVRPLPFVLPTYGHGLRSREVMRVALLLNDLIGYDRSAGVIPDRRIPSGRVIGREAVRAMLPDLDPHGLTGAAVWYDCQVGNTERLALAYLHAAVSAGSVCANYVEATGLLLRGGEVRGVRAVDQLTGGELEVRARTVVNAAGPWVDRLLGALPGAKGDRRFHPSKAMNLVTRRLFAEHAIGFTVPTRFRDSDALINKGTRMFFVVPWGPYSLIGTRHLPFHGDPEEFRITEEDVELFLAEINAACPGVALSRGDVLTVLGGMLPETPRQDRDEVQLVKHSRVYDHAREGATGLVSIVGVKWTTARLGAEEAVDLVEARLRPGAAPQRPVEHPLPGGDIEDVGRFLALGEAERPAAVTPASMRHLLETYGTTSRQVLDYVRQDPSLGRRLADESPVIAAEVTYGVEHEMAQHLGDVVLRRTALAAGGHPGRKALAHCADLMASALDWSPARREAELDATDTALRDAVTVPSS
jgi:glycerol-3-phosphate dehydrogenase